MAAFVTTSSFASPASNLTGLGFDGTNLLSCDSVTDLMYQHNGISAAVLQSRDVSAHADAPKGITYRNSFFNYYYVRGTPYLAAYADFTGALSVANSGQGTDPSGLDWDGANLLACDATNGLIYQHSGHSATVLQSFASPAGNPSGVAFDGTDLYSCDSVTGLIYRHSGISATVLETFTTPVASPTDIAWAGNSLLIADGSTNTIYVTELPPPPPPPPPPDPFDAGRYTLTITGTPPVLLPCANFLARLRSARRSYLQATIPYTQEVADIITARPAEDLELRFYDSEGAEHTVLTVKLDGIQITKGVQSSSIVLNGWRQSTNATPATHADIQAMTVASGTTAGTMTMPGYRPEIKPADTVQANGVSFVAHLVTLQGAARQNDIEVRTTMTEEAQTL